MLFCSTLFSDYEDESEIINYFIFQNDVCVADGTVTGNNGALNGNCYTKQECDQLGGTASGDCAEGYGVCCVCKKFWILDTYLAI